MLQQILEKMYIDPDLLEELSEDQKQMLFMKIREEQVRRWNAFENKMEEEDKKKQKKNLKSTKRNVNFLKGHDGCEWVWVMGDHRNDKTIDQMLEKDTQEMATKLWEAEARVLREKEEAELKRKMEEEKEKLRKEKEEREAQIKRQQEEAALYQSIKEARLAVEKMEIEKKKMEEEEKKKVQEMEEKQKRQKRMSRDFAESMRMKRSSEIFTDLQLKHKNIMKQAEESSKEVETCWLEQEKKAKEADKQIRELASKARTEYKESLRRSITKMQAAQAFKPGEKPPLPPKSLAPKPPQVTDSGKISAEEAVRKHLIQTSAPGITNKKPRPLRPKGPDMIISWFQKEEKDKGTGMDAETGKVATWFHGIINRSGSESLLSGLPDGAFLVRVSERVWGYTLSYKQDSKYKHFLIDASDYGYQFFGADQTVHTSLADLVKFHQENPITITGQEKLVHPCGQKVDPPDYADLFNAKRTESTSL